MAVAIAVVVAAPGPSPVLATTPEKAAPPVTAAAHPSREVFGFALASSLADPTVGYPSWNFDLLSTVAFFGLHVGTGGRFAGDAGWSTWNSSALTNLVAVAHQHGTKVVLTVILQDFSSNTPSMCAGLMSADATVAQTLQEVKAKGVDGVNIDYEGLDGSCGTSDPYWAQHSMTAFAQKMRAGLGSSYYLSVDTYASSASDGYGFFDVAGLAQYVDSFFVMAYDLEYSNYRRPPVSCSSFCLGPTSPLTGYYYNDSNVAAQYVAVVGAGKVIFGVPYYGRKSCVGAAVPNAYATSTVVADSYLDASTEASDPSVQPGSYATHRDTNSSGGERWDTWYNTSLHCIRELYWDDATSLGKKYDLVNSNQLRGVGIWNLNYGGGAPELWSALAAHFSACTGVAVATNPASPQPSKAQVVTFTATSTGCSNPLYEFWLLDRIGWRIVQGYSTSPVFQWNTAGAPPGAWTFSVWVRAATSPGVMPSSMGALDANTQIQFKLLPSCSSVSIAATPGPPQQSGTQITFAASASGCASPSYEFWMRLAGSDTWQMIQAYSSSSTFRWNSSGAAVGTVYFGVWAKDAGSQTTTFDANASIPYAVTAPAVCNSVTISATPAPPIARGTGARVTFSAAASGCTNPSPRYEFWFYNGSGWQVVQAWSTASSWTWNTTGAPAGSWTVVVWVRDAASSGIHTNSLGSYDAYARSIYALS